MPLHLLGKKSWNVYNQDNIARVKRDEAAAAAREADEEQRAQEEDAAARIALLRGEKVPERSLVASDAHDAKDSTSVVTSDGPKRKSHAHDSRDERKRRRKRNGEDDTERDIRLAREDREAGLQSRDHRIPQPKDERSKGTEEPIVDAKGHISLFPGDPSSGTKKSSHGTRKEHEGKDKEKEHDGAGMRFSDAAGRDGIRTAPWYTSTTKLQVSISPNSNMDEATDPGASWGGPSKNVWGREDPGRKARDIARTASNDPLAFMQRAQTQLRRADAERKQWMEERERDVGGAEPRDTFERHERPQDWSREVGKDSRDSSSRRHHRRHRHRDRSRSQGRESGRSERRSDRSRSDHTSRKSERSSARSSARRTIDPSKSNLVD